MRRSVEGAAQADALRDPMGLGRHAVSRAPWRFLWRNGWVFVVAASIAAGLAGGSLAILGGSTPVTQGQPARHPAAAAPSITLAPPHASTSGPASGTSTEVLGLTINPGSPPGVSAVSARYISAPPTPPAGATSAVNCTSSGSTCRVTHSGITVTGAGSGALTLAQYDADPVGVPGTFEPGGPYFDVRLASDQAFGAVTIDQCNIGGSTTLYWWNPAGGSGAGAWDPVVGAPGATFTAGPPACAAVTLRSSGTSPTLSQLTGTVFVAGTPGQSPAAHPPSSTPTTKPKPTTTTTSSTTTTSTTRPTRPPNPPGPPGSSGPPGVTGPPVTGGITTTPAGALFSVTGMVPGDVVPTTLSVQTTGTRAASVTLSESNVTGPLAGQLSLKITQDGASDVIYDGALDSLGVLTLMGGGSHGAWAAGETHTFTVTVTFPASSGNAFQNAPASLDFAWTRN